MKISRIGRFEVTRPVGSGSFATVWLARDEELDAWVAIKLLAENWSFNDDARRRFIEEARALRRLDSDRIVSVYDVGQLSDSRPFIVMEYADRGSLEDRMRLRSQLDQRFSIAEALALSVEIADCLVSVHDHRIVHRDVKPSNILFKTSSREQQEARRRDSKPILRERTLLGDFGIARRLEGPLGHTMVVGSPQYMAPEQADPERAGLADYRSDIYSAAVILYELLSGQVPFATRSMSDLGRVDAHNRAPAIQRLRSDVPIALASAIARALAQDPDGRFASAWEWREALREGARAMVEAARAGAAVATLSLAPRTPTAAGTIAAATSVATDVLREGSRLGQHPPAPSLSPAVPPISPSVVTPGDPVPPAARFPQPAAPEGLRVRVAAAADLLAGALLLAAVILPWATVDGGARDVLGTRFRAGNLAVICGLVLVLVGLRLWRGRRWWLGAFFALVGTLAGATATALAAYQLVVVGEQVRRRLTGPVGRGVAAGYGLYIALALGVIGSIASWVALRRIRRVRQAGRLAAAIELARNR